MYVRRNALAVDLKLGHAVELVRQTQIESDESGRLQRKADIDLASRIGLGFLDDGGERPLGNRLGAFEEKFLGLVLY